MKKSIVLGIVVLLLMSNLLIGCTRKEAVPNDTLTRPQEITNVILNGHINETSDEEKLVTPCCLTYRDYGLVIESEITDKMPESIITDAPNDECQYLTVYIKFINTTSQSLSLSENILWVNADGNSCSEFTNSNCSDKLTIFPNAETDLYCCYIIPKEFDELVITHKKFGDSGSIEFYVNENGRFSRDDISSITAGHRILNTEFENEYIIPVVSGDSDSYYSSSNSNANYTIDNTFDGNYLTCWQDGSDDDGLNEILNYYFESSLLYEIKIVNGNRSNVDSYLQNNRLETILLSFYSAGEEIYETEMCFQDEETEEETTLLLDSPVLCDAVSIKILSVYKGTKYSDTGISEVSFVSHIYSPLGIALVKRIGTSNIESGDSATIVSEEDLSVPEVQSHSMLNPKNIVGEDVPYLKAGDCIRVTGKVDCYVTDEGKIVLNGSEVIGNYGLKIYVMCSDGKSYYELYAPSISDYGFEGQFLEHDTSYTYGGYRYTVPFNCEATIVGRIESYIEVCDGEDRIMYRLSDQSWIESLEFYD